MVSDRDFYFVTNVIANFPDYEQVNRALQEMYANVRFGPPLDSEKKYRMELGDQGFTGLYTKKENFVLPLRELVGDASVTLEDALRMSLR